MAAVWPQPEDTILRQVISDGGSANDASMALGAAGFERSRSSCLGYANRQRKLGKEGYHFQSGTGGWAARRSDAPPAKRRVARKQAAEEAKPEPSGYDGLTEEYKSTAFDGVGRFSFLEVSQDLCAWPLGDPPTACGEPVVTAGRNKVYCAQHSRLAYR